MRAAASPLGNFEAINSLIIVWLLEKDARKPILGLFAAISSSAINTTNNLPYRAMRETDIGSRSNFRLLTRLPDGGLAVLREAMIHPVAP